jgi:hypothetical protein
MSDCQSKTNVILKKLCMNTVHKFNTCCVEYLHIFWRKIISFIFAESRNYRPVKDSDSVVAQCGKFVSHNQDIGRVTLMLYWIFEILAAQFPNFPVRAIATFWSKHIGPNILVQTYSGAKLAPFNWGGGCLLELPCESRWCLQQKIFLATISPKN